MSMFVVILSIFLINELNRNNKQQTVIVKSPSDDESDSSSDDNTPDSQNNQHMNNGFQPILPASYYNNYYSNPFHLYRNIFILILYVNGIL